MDPKKADTGCKAALITAAVAVGAAIKKYGPVAAKKTGEVIIKILRRGQ